MAADATDSPKAKLLRPKSLLVQHEFKPTSCQWNYLIQSQSDISLAIKSHWICVSSLLLTVLIAPASPGFTITRTETDFPFYEPNGGLTGPALFVRFKCARFIPRIVRFRMSKQNPNKILLTFRHTLQQLVECVLCCFVHEFCYPVTWSSDCCRADVLLGMLTCAEWWSRMVCDGTSSTSRYITAPFYRVKCSCKVQVEPGPRICRLRLCLALSQEKKKLWDQRLVTRQNSEIKQRLHKNFCGLFSFIRWILRLSQLQSESSVLFGSPVPAGSERLIPWWCERVRSVNCQRFSRQLVRPCRLYSTAR